MRFPLNCSNAPSQFANRRISKLWTTDQEGFSYRLCNNASICKGLPIVIFRDAVPVRDWVSVPLSYLSHGSILNLRVANGTLVPSFLISTFHGVSKALPPQNRWKTTFILQSGAVRSDAVCSGVVPGSTCVAASGAATLVSVGAAAAGMTMPARAHGGKRSLVEAELVDVMPSNNEEGRSDPGTSHHGTLLLPEICPDVAGEFDETVKSASPDNDLDEENWVDTVRDFLPCEVGVSPLSVPSPPSVPPSPPILHHTVSSTSAASWHH